MPDTLAFNCSCGSVQGTLSSLLNKGGNRLVCHCDDCQAYARYLGDNAPLNKNGGTDIFQVMPRQLHFSAGVEQIRCIRLSNKGMHRWYADCCKTPLANTLGKKSLFAGLPVSTLRATNAHELIDESLGPVMGRLQGRYCIGELPAATAKVVSFAFVFRTLRFFLRWFLSGGAKPSPFFQASGAPVSAPEVLSQEQRTLLNP